MHLHNRSQYENNLYERWAFQTVAGTLEFTSDKADELIGIHRDARYQNGLDDDQIFYLAVSH